MTQNSVVTVHNQLKNDILSSEQLKMRLSTVHTVQYDSKRLKTGL